VPADRSALRREIIGLLEPELEAIGFALLDVRLFAGGGRLNVRIFVDAEGGVDLAACVRASRSAEMLLEESRLLSDPYVIEVSSPGVRRPLRTQEHFAAHLGERVELRRGRGARASVVHGVLLAAGPEGVTVRPAARAEPPRLDADAEGADAEDADAEGADAEDAEGADAEGAEGANAEDTAAAEAEDNGHAGPESAGPESAGTVEIRWEEIESANLDPEFDIHALINADRRRRKEERREERRQARAAREAKAARRRKP
jgi:ribosome maturation factor RimP